MESNRIIKKYLKNYSVVDRWGLVSSATGGVDNAVVIPALAESDHLFEALAALSRNPKEELKRTLVICVVNNRDAGHASPEDIADNQKTLKILISLIYKKNLKGEISGFTGHGFLEEIRESPLRLACVDASSPGRELPERSGGVGLARKTGCDLALTLFDYDSDSIKLIFSLDADTLVEENYLSAVRDCFEGEACIASVISFAHRYLERSKERAAIICYEIFLRYYVMGLEYAGSRYAFHSIGSTMAFTAGGYATVRGMNRRKAGEDFYFFNKMAKVGTVEKIDTTMVHPSARASERVPFGTGKRVGRFLNGEDEEYLLYDPAVFEVVKAWLLHMSSAGESRAEEILDKAGQIHPGLEIFLETQKFREVWPRLVENSGNDNRLRKNFSDWFDGFKTLKLINYLTRNGMPPVDMFQALKRLMEARGEKIPLNVEWGEIPSIQDQEKILDYLRNRG